MSLKIDSKLENKADKRTETAVKSFIGIVMWIVISALVYQVIIK
jgi:hypothetical protein